MKVYSKSDLLNMANELLAGIDCGFDGTPLAQSSNAQKRFEKKRVLKTPMGNRMR